MRPLQEVPPAGGGVNRIKLDIFMLFIRINHVTRADGEALIGKEELTKLLAANIVVYNPFNDRLERGGNTEDFYP